MTMPEPTSADTLIDLVGLSRSALAAEMLGIGEKAFRAKQLWHWIYNRGVTDFAQMTSLAKPLQQKLAELYKVGRPALMRE